MAKVPTAKEHLVHFAKLWEARFGSRYQISWGKEGAQIKKVADTQGAAKTRELITYFLSDFDSEFVRGTGFSVGVFVSQIPKMLVELAKQKADKPKESPDFKRLEAARAQFRKLRERPLPASVVDSFRKLKKDADET